MDYDMAGSSVSPQDRLKAVNDARTFMLQTIGGAAVILGAYATWRRIRVNEDELVAIRDGQITDRFSRAIEHLGNEKADVRMGGMFALARIAQNSPTDSDAITATLSAFVRGHASKEQPFNADVEVPTLALRANDVQVALAVLGTISEATPRERVRIPNTDLRRARMYQLRLDHALLGEANLCGARLYETSLVEADLGNADLRDADLSYSDLRGAWLVGANLRGANLRETRLDRVESDATTAWPDGRMASIQHLEESKY